MSILKIARLGHPVLLQKTKPVKNFAEEQVKKIVHDMSETMLDAGGIGLAAPQVHINKQIIIFRNLEKEIENKKEIKITAIINPKLKNITNDTENEWEGCLSIPGMLGLVKRFSKVKYEGLDISGKIIKSEAEGLYARVIQHEFDHLFGILYTSRLVNKNAYGYVEEIEKFWKQQESEK